MRRMMLTLLATFLISGTPVKAAPLWQGITSEMTIEDVRKLHPDVVPFQENWTFRTELAGIPAEVVLVLNSEQKVRKVQLTGRLLGKEALLIDGLRNRYGDPVQDQDTGRKMSWISDGVLIRFTDNAGWFYVDYQLAPSNLSNAL